MNSDWSAFSEDNKNNKEHGHDSKACDLLLCQSKRGLATADLQLNIIPEIAKSNLRTEIGWVSCEGSN